MTAKDLIRTAFTHSDMIVGAYLSGMSDADLMVRAVPGMNHMAWQVGHLISSERLMVEMIRPGTCPALPEGFDAAHSKETTGIDDASRFLSLAEYKKIWADQRAATLAALDAVSDEELDREDPRFPSIAPTVGRIFFLLGNHPVLHSGQFVAVRRKLDMPIAF